MKKEAGVHRLGQAACEGRAVLPWHGGGGGSLRQVLCRVRAPKPIPSPSPAQESRTWTSGAPSSQAGLTRLAGFKPEDSLPGPDLSPP